MMLLVLVLGMAAEPQDVVCDILPDVIADIDSIPSQGPTKDGTTASGSTPAMTVGVGPSLIDGYWWVKQGNDWLWWTGAQWVKWEAPRADPLPRGNDCPTGQCPTGLRRLPGGG